jgi:hypothetical protein
LIIGGEKKELRNEGYYKRCSENIAPKCLSIPEYDKKIKAGGLK